MLIQILTHTPVYVWVILALLVFRGVVAVREREMDIKKLFIIPVIMLVLSLQDVSAKFGVGLLPLSAWAVGTAGTLLRVWQFGRERVTLGAAAGSVRVPGSWAPLAMMMAIFFTKYVTSVSLVMQPSAAQNVLFSLVVCALYGAFNGYFIGRLARDVMTFVALKERSQAKGPATAAA